MNHCRPFLILIITISGLFVKAQNPQEIYEEFRNNAHKSYYSYRDSVNASYAQFMRHAWAWFQGKESIPMPNPPKPKPIEPYSTSPEDLPPIQITPIIIEPEPIIPQPKPVVPIPQVDPPIETYYININFYNTPLQISHILFSNNHINKTSEEGIANLWNTFVNSEEVDNLIRECLINRFLHKMSDWAYLIFLQKVANTLYPDNYNEATLLLAFLYCQSGYRMRLGCDDLRVYLLIATPYLIYDYKYYVIGDLYYLPIGSDIPDRMRIFDCQFPGEETLSMQLIDEMLLEENLSSPRILSSENPGGLTSKSLVNTNLLDFYNDYPTSLIGDDFLNRWALYAMAPLSKSTKDELYGPLKIQLDKIKSNYEKVSMLLDFVQTAFEYEYDDEVWGQDRAFFAEETLFYQYCDCEDRAILFSRLIRDLLGLKVALVYYPGHLASAVCFEDENVSGDWLNIEDKKYVICDPTYIYAPVGKSMPDCPPDQAKAIVLR